ncbi:hypothetical protein SPRG_09647 [Saprolegnia parasitica CBS 223.65]|uniref:Uncharacterized protein n=1 Tax=Saprolegnia parasitica (strain CBS 223.65) TaxID=695850 RepID=A0A067C221_SAPPC|nr:hypothetical protein SPRG_09647 [Saprolegnia parasitica CBS 223.65]KDO24814.1 hypothetical protein SPRG_09647 [Saprolegnia parasitica CBS 223.65]|eukprot:XP_012204462.1 hypothetical protein SPRG_09647 [Saprolegnia parasitica CBS 223.65]
MAAHDINALTTNKDGATALLLAIEHGHSDCALLLSSRRADVNVPSTASLDAPIAAVCPILQMLPTPVTWDTTTNPVVLERDIQNVPRANATSLEVMLPLLSAGASFGETFPNRVVLCRRTWVESDHRTTLESHQVLCQVQAFEALLFYDVVNVEAVLETFARVNLVVDTLLTHTELAPTIASTQY